MLNYLMVDVVKISSPVSRSTFSESDLENLAEIILETGGILKPLIIKKVGFEKYEVIDGHFEYYASLKASEKDVVKGEMVNSFILTSEQQALAKQQIKQLQPIPTTGSGLDNDARINNLEKRFNELQDNHKALETRMKELENKQSPPPLPALEALNTFDVSQLVKAGIRKNIAKLIIIEREKSEFTSFTDAIKRVRGLAEKTMIKFIDYLAN